MGVDHALGVAGRAARVAHGGRGSFVEFGIGKAGRLEADDGLVVDDVLAGGERRVVAFAAGDDRLDLQGAGR